MLGLLKKAQKPSRFANGFGGALGELQPMQEAAAPSLPKATGHRLWSPENPRETVVHVRLHLASQGTSRKRNAGAETSLSFRLSYSERRNSVVSPMHAARQSRNASGWRGAGPQEREAVMFETALLYAVGLTCIGLESYALYEYGSMPGGHST